MTKIRLQDISIGKRIRSDLGDIEELASSISSDGLICPIRVRKAGKGYKLLAGHRRVEACKMLGHKTIESTVE